MNKISLYNELLDIFDFRTICDSLGNEFVIYKNSSVCLCDDEIILDRTAFEALENHVHLIDNVKRYDKKDLIELGEKAGKLLVDRLSFCFPEKHFVVFVTITDSMIVRFHQKWGNEPYYYSDENRNEKEYLITFDN